MKFYHDILSHWAPNVTLAALIDEQRIRYEEKHGEFASPMIWMNASKMNPFQWWKQYGKCVPELRLFALKAFSVATTASPCERNWSAYDHIYEKKRAKLAPEKATDLVYCYQNQRFLDRPKVCPENDDYILWEAELPSEAEIDPDEPE